MIRIFISQPMNGKTEEQIKEERRSAAMDAANKVFAARGVRHDIEVMHTVFDLEEGTHPLVYLGKSIEMMADADYVYFAPGWKDARGCMIEHECAARYGKRIMYSE